MSSSGKINALFESLHRQYHPMVLQMCLGFMKGDPYIAKDLSQEIFINIWNALEKFQGKSSYKTWVYRIAVNTCLLYLRDNKKKQTISLGEVAQPMISDSADKDEYHELYQAIGKLAELDRLIIMLVLEELEYDEISTITGINPINLRVKIHRIKKKMKQLLKEEQTHG